jgi:tripartite-type tricarboxylate transporter receptor subunit TctC
MKLARRKFLHLAAGAAALPAVSPVAKAQAYPSRPVRIIVGFAAGGPTDIIARLLGQWLSERLGQRFLIENRTGASGNIVTEAVVKAAPDGHTLLQITVNNATSAALYDNLNFNFLRDVAPVATVSRSFGIMLVNPSFPAKTVPEFITYAKANPGKISMASGGSGGSQHLYGELFKMMAGVDMLHVPYRGSAPALTDLIGGQVQVIFESTQSALEHVRVGTLRPLAVTGARRLESLPDVPALGEFLPGYEASVWQGIGAPRNTPQEIIEKLNREINAGLADPKIKARFIDLGAEVLPGSPAEFGKLLADETEKWGKVIRAANIKAE